MKRWMQRVIKLYPQSWRDRYGQELEALLEEVPPGWRPFFDILRSGLALQLRTWSGGRILAVLATAGSLVGLIVSMAAPQQYASDVEIQQIFPVSEDAPATRQAINHRLQQLIQAGLNPSSLARIIHQFSLYESKRGQQPLENAISVMRNAIRIQPLGTSRDVSRGFVVQFVYPDPVLAQRVAQELVGSLLDQAGSEEAIREVPITLLITRPASRPSHAWGPGWWIASPAGLVAGLLLGLLMLTLREERQAGNAFGSLLNRKAQSVVVGNLS